MNQLAPLPSPALPVPLLVAVAGDKANTRFLEFFAANIRNPNTRRAYIRAVAEFLSWCEVAGVSSIAEVAPLHMVSTSIMRTKKENPSSSVKSCAAVRRGLACSHVQSLQRHLDRAGDDRPDPGAP
jgi:integrase/recombinase XerC